MTSAANPTQSQEDTGETVMVTLRYSPIIEHFTLNLEPEDEKEMSDIDASGLPASG